MDKEIDEGIIIQEGALSTGIEYTEIGLLIITGEELFSPIKKRKPKSILFKQGEKVVYRDLKIGDYVVHITHGIGQFIGVNTITTADKITKDYIKIKYRDDDCLYIPTNALDNIRKYIGAGEKVPKLNRLRK